MPTYEYRCSACGRQVEVMHGIHDQGPASCEACGGAMRKALSSPAILFKGSGWAKKDAQAAGKSRSGGPAKEASGGATDTSTSAAGDTKPDHGTTAPVSKPAAATRTD